MTWQEKRQEHRKSKWCNKECPGRNKDRNFAAGNVSPRMTWQEKRQEHRKSKWCNKIVLAGTKTGTLQEEYSDKNDLAGKKTGTSQKEMLQQECPGRNKDRNFAIGNVTTRMSWQENR
jgi:hypothetical protein